MPAKHTQKKSPRRRAPRVRRPAAAVPAPTDLFGASVSGGAPLTLDGQATAPQLARLLAYPAIDDSLLRRLSGSGGGRQWFPPPVRTRYALAPDKTGRSPLLAGLWEWQRAQANHRGGLLATYPTIGNFLDATGFPQSMLDHAIAHGSNCVKLGSRVDLMAFLATYTSGAGQPGGLSRFERMFNPKALAAIGEGELTELNLDEQRAGLTLEQKLEKQRENAHANSLIHTLAEVMKLVQIEYLSPLRESLHGLAKKLTRYPRLDPTGEVRADLTALLRALSESRPGDAHQIATREPEQPPMEFNI